MCLITSPRKAYPTDILQGGLNRISNKEQAFQPKAGNDEWRSRRYCSEILIFRFPKSLWTFTPYSSILRCSIFFICRCDHDASKNASPMHSNIRFGFICRFLYQHQFHTPPRSDTHDGLTECHASERVCQCSLATTQCAQKRLHLGIRHHEITSMRPWRTAAS